MLLIYSAGLFNFLRCGHTTYSLWLRVCVCVGVCGCVLLLKVEIWDNGERKSQNSHILKTHASKSRCCLTRLKGCGRSAAKINSPRILSSSLPTLEPPPSPAAALRNAYSTKYIHFLARLKLTASKFCCQPHALCVFRWFLHCIAVSLASFFFFFGCVCA